jgi:predicted lipid-binding transport protein (Tim44 family)
MSRFNTGNLGAIALGLSAVVMLTVPHEADARRGGSFGSRGARTFQAPPKTQVAPRQSAPVQRSMTEKSANPAAAQSARTAPANRGGGMAKGLIGGLIAGGLIGALLGGGLGSLAGSGMLMALLQVALIGGAAFLLIRMFRRRQGQAPAMAGAHGGAMPSPFANMAPRQDFTPAPSRGFSAAPVAAAATGGDLPIDDADRAAFERLLVEVQDAFGKEDYARLRERTTPEVMSYFAEELGQNATSGRRNEVSGTQLLDAEVAEAWSEGADDYATIAMRYESIDVMRDRTTGAVIEGNPDRPTQVTELWTFKRDPDGSWRLSAVQEA